MLRGATTLLQECRPLLWCELWADYTERYGYTPAELFAFLTERQYQTFLIDDGAKLTSTDAATYPGQRDILAIPAETPSTAD